MIIIIPPLDVWPRRTLFFLPAFQPMRPVYIKVESKHNDHDDLLIHNINITTYGWKKLPWSESSPSLSHRPPPCRKLSEPGSSSMWSKTIIKKKNIINIMTLLTSPPSVHYLPSSCTRPVCGWSRGSEGTGRQWCGWRRRPGKMACLWLENIMLYVYVWVFWLV